MAEEKDDFIGKRVNDVRKIFGMAERDWLLLFLIVSIGFNIFQAYDSRSLQKEWKEEIVNELRRDAIPQEVQKRLPQAVEDAVQPMKEGVEQGMQKLDTVLNKVINKE